jgi:hypothetical protein
VSGRPPSQRRWTHGDLVVLKTLVRSGETLASLAARLGRPRGAVMLKCAELMLPLAPI